MIGEMKKVLLVGTKNAMDAFFARAQEEGYLEFINMQGKKALEIPASIHQLVGALKILRKLPSAKIIHGNGKDLETARKIAQRILSLKDSIEKLMEEKRLLQAEIARVSPFGDFSMDDIHYIEQKTGRRIQFFCRKTSRKEDVVLPEEMIYVGTDYDLDYFVCISAAPVFFPGMIEMRIDRSVRQLREHLSMVRESLNKTEDELKSYAGALRFLHEALIEELNNYHLHKAKKEVAEPYEGTVFAIEAWLPKSKMRALYQLIAPLPIHAEEIAIDPEDKVPTYMSNKGLTQLGEDLVRIYDIPATSDRDPSMWVLWAFALFFAMIINDGGYGLIYLAIAGLLYWKRREAVRRSIHLFKLLVVLGMSCVVWGILTTSYFGIKIAPENPLNRVSLTQYLIDKKLDYHLKHRDDVYHEWQVKIPEMERAHSAEQLFQMAPKSESKPLQEMLDEFNDNILLEFALLVGMIHIIISLLRYCLRNPSNLGWVLFVIGGYLFFPSMLNATSLVNFMGWIDKATATKSGLQILYSGIGLALVIAFIRKRLRGFEELMQSIQVFADILSYLRLYALGLAGSVMASTFNEIGVGMGLFIGALVILAGHVVNAVLASMSGVIHGLRLNFLEWYHYSFEGGGKLFNPLRKLKAK